MNHVIVFYLAIFNTFPNGQLFWEATSMFQKLKTFSFFKNYNIICPYIDVHSGVPGGNINVTVCNTIEKCFIWMCHIVIDNVVLLLMYRLFLNTSLSLSLPISLSIYTYVLNHFNLICISINYLPANPSWTCLVLLHSIMGLSTYYSWKE